MSRGTTRASLLAHQLDDAYRMIRERVEGLTDDEFWWTAVPEAWTVRRHPDGRWAVDYEEPDPLPAPFTTIAWRLVHVAECKLMYHEYAYGPARLRWLEIDSVHTARDAVAQLDHGHALLVADLAALDDEDLDQLRPTNWGEHWPASKIFWTMIHHDVHHGAEIGVLRDLYRLGRG